MKNTKIKKLVLASILAAFVCIATAVFSFPLPGNGFANLGDCFVIICGGLIGPWWGFAAAAVGAAIADVLLGFAVYAPVTFFIKGIMSLVVYNIAAKNGNHSIIRITVSAVLAEIVMVLGYFLFELLVYGTGGAVPNIFGNTLQGIVGAITGTVLLSVLTKNKKLYSFFE